MRNVRSDGVLLYYLDRIFNPKKYRTEFPYECRITTYKTGELKLPTVEYSIKPKKTEWPEAKISTTYNYVNGKKVYGTEICANDILYKKDECPSYVFYTRVMRRFERIAARLGRQFNKFVYNEDNLYKYIVCCMENERYVVKLNEHILYYLDKESDGSFYLSSGKERVCDIYTKIDDQLVKALQGRAMPTKGRA